MYPYNSNLMNLYEAGRLLSFAEADSKSLASMGKPMPNPYGFAQRDVNWAGAQCENARQSQIVLREMLLTEKYSRLGEFIPDQEQIDTGKDYWSKQMREIDSLAFPYWMNQREWAKSADDSSWMTLCDDMLDLQGMRIEMIDAILGGLHADESLIDWPGWETPEHVVERKILVEQVKLTYYAHAILALYSAIRLEVADWSGIDLFIADSMRIEMGRTYWLSQVDSTTSIWIPFWETEKENSAKSGDAARTEFCQALLSNLNTYLDLASVTLLDLSADSTLIAALSGERIRDIWERKFELAVQRVAYYRDLVDVVELGVDQGILGRL